MPLMQRTCRRQRGLSLVEMMIGIALGLFIVAGAVTMVVTSITESRRLVLDARVNQDLRAAADLVARDLRRAGFWENAVAGTTANASGTASTSNPHQGLTLSGSTITYSLARDSVAGRSPNDNTVDGDERFGFRLNNQALEMQVANDSWQAVTDTRVTKLTALQIVARSEPPIQVLNACAKECCDASLVTAGVCTVTNVASPPGCPKVEVRRYEVTVSAEASNDPGLKRTLREEIRVRNDAVTGVCPP